MNRSTTRLSLCTLLSGLALSACGGVSDATTAPGEEALGTRESALCYGAYVADVSVGGISTYEGTMGGGGSFSVGGGANAIRLEYYVDDAPMYHTEYVGNDGAWNYSYGGFGCQVNAFHIKAFPMVIDSNGNRTTCTASPFVTGTFSPSNDCAPIASLSCSRSGSQIKCTASAKGGTGPYTPRWYETYDYGGDGWFNGAWSQSFFCGSMPTSCFSSAAEASQDGVAPTMRPPPGCEALERKQIYLKVVDGNGRESATRFSATYPCY